MNQFSTFPQRPSPQARAPRPQKMLQIMLVSWAKVSSRLDKMAPQLCPFEISENQKNKSLSVMPKGNFFTTKALPDWYQNWAVLSKIFFQIFGNFKWA